MEVAQPPTGIPEGWELVQAPPPPAPAPSSSARPSVSARAGVPAAGRGTQFNHEQAQRGAATVYDAATTPLAHPTGIDMVDQFTSPVGAASLAMGGAGIMRALAKGGVMAAAHEATALGMPMVKYEAARGVLRSLGVPEWAAAPIAAVVASLNTTGAPKGQAGKTLQDAMTDAVAEGKLRAHPHAGESGLEFSQRVKADYRAANPATAAPSAPPVAPVASAPVAPAPPVEPVSPTVAPPPTSASAPTQAAPPPGNLLPDQRALNEAALAARRAAYQARTSQAPVAEPAAASPAASGHVKLTGAETTAFLDLLRRGTPSPDAMRSILAQRAFNQQMGLTTPTAAQTRFPKGMRGKVSTP